MDSSKVQVYLSGYGPFYNVPKNPTETIVKEIEGEKAKYQKPQFEYAMLAVAQVCDKGSMETVDKFYSHIKERGDDGKKSLVVHLGVDPNGECINVEQYAYNCKTYSRPDQSGYMTQNELITKDMKLDQPISSLLNCKLLCESSSPEVFKESDDPGRYLCNNIYFRSLDLIQKELKVPCLFLHMPPFQVLDMSAQLDHLAKFLGSVCSCL